MDLDATVREWARLFDAEQYYEAHEVAEAHWHQAVEPDRTFLKGLIHAAVSLAHLQRGNRHGARVKGRSARRYLAGYAPAHAGIEVEALIGALERFLTPLDLAVPGEPDDALRPRSYRTR